MPRDLLDVAHRRRRFTGRDPHESNRAATPLELLYDLTMVVAFGTAADELAHYVADDHVWVGVAGFLFAAFAVSWAWSQYTWFASAYDTDDWVFRLATMVQMLGVVVLALGLSQAFASIDHGDTLDNGVMVAGYVVMRTSMLFLWWQASRHDPARARAARTYIATITLAQIGWVALVFLDLSIATTFAAFAVLLVVELSGPVIAERRKGGIPWHVHHMAERYGLLVIITLGEGIIGTVASLNAVVHGGQGWTFDAGLLAFAGIGLTFASWWVYFAIPWADMVTSRPGRSQIWAYGHIIMVGALAAIGAGLHVAAYYLEHEARVGTTAVVLSVAIPVGVYLLTLYAIFTAVMGVADRFHIGLLVGTGVVLGAAVALAAAGAGVPACVAVLMLAPIVTVVGYETIGHRHVRVMLDGARP